jgi:hypothetical protein
MCDNLPKKICKENIFTVFNTLGCLYDSLNLPDDVRQSLQDTIIVCEPYLENGFSYSFPCDE